MILFFFGIIVIIGGIVLLAVKKKKVPAIIAMVAGVLLVIIGFAVVDSEFDYVQPDEQAGDNYQIPMTDSVVEVPLMNGVSSDKDSVQYDTDFVSISIEPDTEGDLDPQENPAKLHPEDTVKGVTEDGIQWSTAAKDGTGTIHMNVNGKPVSAKVTPKADSKSGSKDKADAGKAAAAVSKLVNTAYKKGSDNYNHNYAIWYVEPAQCLVYYPAQLELSESREDGTTIFTDKKSKAKLKISLSENNYASMDEVENFIANSEYSTILASGTDWFSSEVVGKTMTQYDVTGLGQKFEVNVELTYENKYNFVFNELRTLIKCEFVEGGKWVSTAKDTIVGKNLGSAQKRYANGFKYSMDAWYFEDEGYMLYYPNVFTKAYKGDNGVDYFTDTSTGAYIACFMREHHGNLNDIVKEYQFTDFEYLNNDTALRGYNAIKDYFKFHYVLLEDGIEYHAIMVFNEKDDFYRQPANEMYVASSSVEIRDLVVRDLFFAEYDCTITVPGLFVPDGQESGSYHYIDNLNGIEMNVSFIEDDSKTGSIFDEFDIRAEDRDIDIKNNVVKWHNKNGIFIGAVGAKYNCLVEIPDADAYDYYRSVWEKLNIRFTERTKDVTVADKVGTQVYIFVIMAENAAVMNEPIVEEDEPSVTAEAQKTEKKAPAVTPAVVAQPVNHEVPHEDNWTHDDTANVVLWYKSYDDYYFTTESALAWLAAERALGSYYGDQYRLLTLLRMCMVLRYNEYKTNINSAWVEEYALDRVDEIVNDWYYHTTPRKSSQLGENIPSVFEAFCMILGIDDIPDYTSNAVEKPIVPEEPKATPTPTAEPVYQGYTIADMAGYWAPLVVMFETDYAYLLTENGEVGVYKGSELIARGIFSVNGDTIAVETDDGYIDAFYYRKDGGYLYNPTSALILNRQEFPKEAEKNEDPKFITSTPTNDPEPTASDPTPTPSPSPTPEVEEDEPYYVLNPEYEYDYRMIARRVDHESFLEEYAAALGINKLGVPEYESYGISSFASFDKLDTTEFINNLKSRGLKYNGEDNTEGHAVGYIGELKGYEQFGTVNVTVTDIDDRTEIAWMYVDYFDVDEIWFYREPGVPLNSLPFDVYDFGYGDVYTSVRGTSYASRVCAQLMAASKQYLRQTNSAGTGYDPDELFYNFTFGGDWQEYDEYYDYGLKNAEQVLEKYGISHKLDHAINNEDAEFFQVYTHSMYVKQGQYDIILRPYYIPGYGVYVIEHGELVCIAEEW